MDDTTPSQNNQGGVPGMQQPATTVPTQFPVQPLATPPQDIGAIQQSPQPVQPNTTMYQQPLSSQQLSQLNQDTGVIVEQNTMPVPTTEDKPQITMDDLYGASQPHELQPPSMDTPIDLSQQPTVQQPIQPEVPQEIPEVTVNTSPQEVPLQQLPPEPQQMVGENVSSGMSDGEVASDVPEEEKTTFFGFSFPPFVKYIIGGFIGLIIIIILITFISSLFHGQPSGKVTLTYWGLWEDSNVMQSVIGDYERQHPDVTINYSKQDPKDYPKRLLTRIQNGDGPDIFRYHNSWTTPLQSVLAPLPANVIDSHTLSTVYFPVVSKDLVKNGALYGVPLNMDTLALFINKDIFQHAGAQVPTSWDQFITVSKALTVKDTNGKIQTAGAALGTVDNVTHAPDIIALLFAQNGANNLQLGNSSNGSDALTFYTSFAKPGDNVWDDTLDNSLLAFSRGKLAMYFGYSWDIFSIRAVTPNLNYAIYPVPHLPNRDMTIASYWVEGLSNKSAHQKEAAAFLQFLAQKDTQTKLYTAEAQSRGFGEIYARSDLAGSLASNDVLAPFVKQAKTAFSTIFYGETSYDEFNGALNVYLRNAVVSILKDTSNETALATLAQGVAQVFSQYAQSP